MTTLAPSSAERRVVLSGISWALYQDMLAEIGDGHTRLTYDRGRLEIMSPSDLHERVKKVAGRLIEAYGDEVGISVEGYGSTTFQREDLQRGLEPDECYYITSAGAVTGKEELDLTVDPPPDLAIEIDISRPDVARQPIYAALGVPEVWRYDGRSMTLLRRDAAGNYKPATSGWALPELRVGEFNRLLKMGLTNGQSAGVRALRAWTRGAP